MATCEICGEPRERITAAICNSCRAAGEARELIELRKLVIQQRIEIKRLRAEYHEMTGTAHSLMAQRDRARQELLEVKGGY